MTLKITDNHTVGYSSDSWASCYHNVRTERQKWNKIKWIKLLSGFHFISFLSLCVYLYGVFTR